MFSSFDLLALYRERVVPLDDYDFKTLEAESGFGLAKQANVSFPQEQFELESVLPKCWGDFFHDSSKRVNSRRNVTGMRVRGQERVYFRLM